MGKQLVLTAVQAALVLGVGKSTIYRRLACGALPSKTVDAKLVIPLSALKKQLTPETYEVIKFRLESGADPTPVQKQPAAAAKRPCKKAYCKKGAKK